MKSLNRFIFFSVLILGALLVIFPFLWMLSTALKVEGKGMKFEFIPRADVTVGLFELGADGKSFGPNKNDRTSVGDSMVRFAYFAPEARAVEISLRDGLTASLKKGEDGVWALDQSLPFETYKYEFALHRDWKGALKSLYTFDNFTKIWSNTSYPFGRYLVNSFIVAISSSLLTVLICALAAYVFAKKNFPGKQFLFWMFMGAMMIPGMMYMVPQFAIVSSFGWMNSLQGLVVPHLSNVFGLFMLKQMMESIPDSLFEAARMDGAGEWTVFRVIVIPLSLPALAILFLLTFVGQWNNFLWQLIVNTPDSPFLTLPVGLALFKGQYQTQWEQMMAASSFSILPIVALFLFTQKFLIEGLTAGGVKE